MEILAYLRVLAKYFPSMVEAIIEDDSITIQQCIADLDHAWDSSSREEFSEIEYQTCRVLILSILKK